MILVWGPADDPPLERVAAALRARGADVVQLDDDRLDALTYEVTLAAEPTGWLALDRRRVSLADVRGIYLRPGTPPSPQATTASAALLAIAARTPAVVVNRPAAGASNLSKPHQLRLIAAAGLVVPETLVTTDPDAARDFLRMHRRLVYKSLSGVRSIVAMLDESAAARLDGVATGPVQLQRWIDGIDVRVHVVGERCFATAIESAATDYRYAPRDGADLRMQATDLPPDLERRLVALTRDLGLLVSGIDLRRAPDGTWCCFEVNPSPGFTFYEDHTAQPIAAAIAALLLRAERGGIRSRADAARPRASRRQSTRAKPTFPQAASNR